MPATKPFDLSVYVITDSRLSRGRSNLTVIKEAIAGGATCIQLREKDLPTGQLFHAAEALRELTLQKGITFIVNDRLDVALAVEADGVHLGRDDLPVAAARRIMPPEMILGVTARNVQQALQFQEAGASYLGVGAVFATFTKGNTGKPIGLHGLAEIVQRVKIPVVGIGGIKAQNAGDVVSAGAGGVAVVSAVVSVVDVAGATRDVARAVYAARSQQRG
ncbi:MAG: thiamine phosphate synthase [Bacillota bacterium]